MKINPLDKQHLVKSTESASAKKSDGVNFDKVLEKTLQASSGAGAQPAEKTPAPMRPLMQPSLDGCKDPGHRLDRLLNHLESYQRLLGDNRASLKAVAPAVRQLKGDLDEVGRLMDTMSAEHPLKPVLNEALVVVSKEIVRFESGVYV